MTTALKYIKQTIQKEFQKKKDDDYDYKKLYSEKLIKFRHLKDAVTKIEKPSNIPRARSLGYKAKQGFIVVLVKVRKGSGLVRRPNRGRRPKRMGVNKITRRISIQRMAENKADRKFANLEVLNSYMIGKDGINYFFEVICVDPQKPEIQNDRTMKWICKGQNKNRPERGITSAGQKSRGLRSKSPTSKVRPSVRAGMRRGK